MISKAKDYSTHFCVECRQLRPCRYCNKQSKWWCDRHAQEIFHLPPDRTIAEIQPRIRHGQRGPQRIEPDQRQCVVCREPFTPRFHADPKQSCGDRACREVLRIQSFKKTHKAKQTAPKSNIKVL